MGNAIKQLIILLIALTSIILFHRFYVNKSSENASSVNMKEVIISSYDAYSLSKFEAAKAKMMQYAEQLYQKDLAEGETDKEFEGLTVAEYCWNALDEYDEELNVQKELALFLPRIRLQSGIAFKTFHQRFRHRNRHIYIFGSAISDFDLCRNNGISM